jgi:hypothetical protein
MRIKMKTFHEYINEAFGSGDVEDYRKEIKEHLDDHTTYILSVDAAIARVKSMDEKELLRHKLSVKEQDRMLGLLTKARSMGNQEKVIAAIDKIPEEVILLRGPEFIRDSSKSIKIFAKICGLFIINALDTLKGKL